MNEAAIPETFSIWGCAGAYLFGAAMLWLGGYLVSVVTGAVFEKWKVHEATHDAARIVIFSILGAFVPVAAALSGHPEMAIGALAGQGMATIGLLVGISAMCRDLPVDPGLRIKELPILLASVVVFAVLVRVGMFLDRTDGFILIFMGVCCSVFLMLKKKTTPESRIPADKASFLASYFLRDGNVVPLRLMYMAVFAILILAVGAAFVVDSIVRAGTHYDFSLLALGATVLSLVGALPFVSAAAGAGVLKRAEKIPGYAAGVVIFNLLLCGGLTVVVSPLAIPPAFFRVEIAAIFGISALLWLFVRTRDSIGKLEGAVLFVTYAALVWACLRGSF